LKRQIGICGLGYVGTVTGACLARDGHEVVGFDVVPARVTMVGNGVAPFVEPGLGELLKTGVEERRLRATTNIFDAVSGTEAMILCVGTPTGEDEVPDLRYVANAAAMIGEALRGGTTPYTVLMRSTVPPGTIEEVVIPELERASRRLVGGDGGLHVLAVPEFLREASAIADFDDPAIIVVGGPKPASARERHLVEDLFKFPERIHWVGYRTAELLKCVCNAFHATKAVFANEVGTLCESLGIDGVELMGILCEDRKLNTSAAYLRPGGPFGGSCLPKDLRALLYLSRKEQLPSLLLRATLESNDRHIQRTVEHIEQLGVRRIGLDGLAFKNGTDDLRESPMVAIAEALLERGYDLRIHDPAVMRTHLHKDRAHIPLLRHLVESPQDLLRHAELIVARGSSERLTHLATAMGTTTWVVELGRRPFRIGAESELEAEEMDRVEEAVASE
jgi:GDP-mannose 6-dehydrogenase